MIVIAYLDGKTGFKQASSGQKKNLGVCHTATFSTSFQKANLIRSFSNLLPLSFRKALVFGFFLPKVLTLLRHLLLSLSSFFMVLGLLHPYSTQGRL